MVLIALIALLSPIMAASADDAAFFSRPAQVYAGRRAPLRLHDARSRRLRSALEDAYEGPVDFAGRYVLAEIGCGAACLKVAALDVKTGAVRWLPDRVADWPKSFPDPLEHRADSRLLIVHGRLGEAGAEGSHALVFDGRRFAAL